MAVGRFERKIVAAIAAVAVMPLIGALVLGQRALREAYAVGVNEQVEGELERGLSLYQAHFAALREDAERTVDAIGHDVELNLALAPRAPEQTITVQPAAESQRAAIGRALSGLLARYHNVISIQVRRGGEVLAAREQSGIDRKALSPLELDAPLAKVPALHVHVVVGTAASTFNDYQRAGEVSEVYRALKQGSEYVSGFYLAIYTALLASVIVFALGIGITLSRRVTRRVAQLAEATSKVGSGDLSVNVPVSEQDEVGDLTRAFNEMVRDMRESKERIEYLSRIGAWQEFARRLAHEIKNPLTPIQLAVQEVHRSYKGEDPGFRRTLEDARAIVEEEIATLRRLVSEFSEFARLPEAHLAPADLGVFVRDALDAPFRAEESDDQLLSVEVRAEVEPVPLPVLIDGMLLKRCLDNLVRNAVQAIRGVGKSGGRVIVSVRSEALHALLEVCDNGPGVPSEARERIFDPYYTTKSDGTGLGLAIVKKIVLEHGGEIAYREAPEGGACLRITLPFRRNTRPGGASTLRPGGTTR